MRIVVSLVAAIALTRAVTATVIVPADFREVVAGSQIIVVGRVIDVRAEWADGRRQINSYVTVDVASTLKGTVGETVTFLVPGGQLGRYRSVMIGAPVFAPGDEAMLFLDARGTIPHVFGLNQGVYRVQVDMRNGRRMVLPPLLSRGETPEIVRRGAPDRVPVPLETFAAQVRAIVAEGAGAGGAGR